MPFTSGTRLGPYEILAPLGAGGMGDVYRAADTRLNRTVAVKVLRADVADDPDRRQRFEREARAVSHLAHPHICGLYDVGRENDVEFLVMEFVEGDTLERRLVTGPLTVSLALRYAVEIADALDHAHRRGIIHRDLKPANIMITRSGVKLLDFGLAKSRTEDVIVGSSSSSAAIPTRTLTGEGIIVGTLQYMAPEQLEGRAVDARTDLFSFGAVLYEMLTARKAFGGQSQASVIAAVLRGEPPAPSSFQPLMPAALDRLVRKCLAKDPDDRWQTARDVMSELQWIQESSGQTQISAPMARGQQIRRTWIAWTVMLILVASLGLWSVFFTQAFRHTAIDVRPITFVVSPPEGTTLPRAGTAVAVAPDGHRLAFLASHAGIVHLWVRSLESLEAHELPETDGARGPFWSPDSQSLAFFSGGSLKRIEVSGGRPQIICESGGATGAWSGEGVILFDSNEGLSRVSATGGSVARVTRLDRSASETRHDYPQFVPDGRHFVYVVSSSQPDHAGLYLGSLDSADGRRLHSGQSNAVYAPPGYLLFARNSGQPGPFRFPELVAQPFNAATLQFSGQAVTVADFVASRVARAIAVFSASNTGVLAYVPPTEKQLTWVDRAGRSLGSVGAGHRNENPALSYDDTRLAADRVDPATGIADVWVIDVARGIEMRLTSHGGGLPVWSPDGTTIAFVADRGGKGALYEKRSSGEGTEEPLLTPETDAWPADWSSDGRFLLFFGRRSKPSLQLWVLPLSGDRRAASLMETGPLGDRARLSPNGRWLAYASNESGVSEVYVRTFPTGDEKWRVSTRGGIEPRWRRDGRELFFIAADQYMTSVPVNPDVPFRPGVPTALFETRAMIDTSPIAGRQYVVSGDGQRFLLNQPTTGSSSPPITVVVNWPSVLRR